MFWILTWKKRRGNLSGKACPFKEIKEVGRPEFIDLMIGLVMAILAEDAETGFLVDQHGAMNVTTANW